LAAAEVEVPPAPIATTGGDDGKPETYTTAVERFKAAGKSPGESFKLAQRQCPVSHQAWVVAEGQRQAQG
jgi:hypothetical protein